MVRCFERQTYQNRELVILDDAQQYESCRGPNWRLVSVRRRFPSLGAKRNAAARLVSNGVQAICPWDDDDLYMPWHLEATAWALERADWSRPSLVLHYADGRLRQHCTYGRPDKHDKAFQGGWGVRLQTFWAVGGYNEDTSNGEDKLLARKLARTAIEADYCRQWPPAYIWGPWPAPHLSCLGPANEGYERLSEVKSQLQPFAPCDPPDEMLDESAIAKGIYPRIFNGDWS